jgi:hypothetical protein
MVSEEVDQEFGAWLDRYAARMVKALDQHFEKHPDLKSEQEEVSGVQGKVSS